MAYKTKVKHLETKIDKGEFKDRDGLLAIGKRLCTKVNTLLQNFCIIKGKLEAQRLFASLWTVERDTRVKGQSQGFLETIAAEPSSSRVKPRPRSASIG